MGNYKTGDRLFFIDPFVQRVHECEVELSQYDMTTKQWLYKIHDLTSFGSCMMREEDLFEREEDAQVAFAKEQEDRLQEYKAFITDEIALIQFALSKSVSGEDCDPIARLAYETRAKELGLWRES